MRELEIALLFDKLITKNDNKERRRGDFNLCFCYRDNKNFSSLSY